MDENNPKNIFDAVSQAKKMPSKKPPVSSAKATPAKAPAENLSREKKDAQNLHTDPEINQMLNQMLDMREDITTKLSNIYEKAGLSVSQVKNYLDNPNNFPPDIWQKIQLQRDSLEKRIGDVLKTYAKKKKKGHVAGLRETGGAKERKSKTLGARRNWIPM